MNFALVTELFLVTEIYCIILDVGQTRSSAASAAIVWSKSVSTSRSALHKVSLLHQASLHVDEQEEKTCARHCKPSCHAHEKCTNLFAAPSRSARSRCKTVNGFFRGRLLCFFFLSSLPSFAALEDALHFYPVTCSRRLVEDLNTSDHSRPLCVSRADVIAINES